MAYPFPSYIQAPERLGAQYLAGISAGSSIVQHQQQLRQEANLAELNAMMRSQEMERNTQLERERLSVEQQYHRQELALRQKELEQAQQLNQIKVQEAARLFQANKQFQADLAANRDPVESVLRNFPGTGEPLTGIGTLAREYYQSKRKLPPGELIYHQIFGKDVPFIRTEGRYGNIEEKEVRADPTAAAQRRDLERKLAKDQVLLDLHPGKDKATQVANDPAAYAALEPITKSHVDAYREIEQRIEKEKADIDAIDANPYAPYNSSNQTAPPPPAATAPPGSGVFKILRPLPAASGPAATGQATTPVSGAQIPATQMYRSSPGAIQPPDSMYGPPAPSSSTIGPLLSDLGQGTAAMASRIPLLRTLEDAATQAGSGIRSLAPGFVSAAKGLIAPVAGGINALAPVVGRGAQNLIGGARAIVPAMGQGAENLVGIQPPPPSYPSAPESELDRSIDQVYMTEQGPQKWTKGGWQSIQ
jgi:hypothetical protein